MGAESLLDGSEKSRSIAVVANQLAIADGHRVHGTQLLGQGIHFVHRIQGFELVRDGDIHSHKSACSHLEKCVFHFASRHLKPHILAINPDLFQCRIVHLRGLRVTNGIANHREPSRGL